MLNSFSIAHALAKKCNRQKLKSISLGDSSLQKFTHLLPPWYVFVFLSEVTRHSRKGSSFFVFSEMLFSRRSSDKYGNLTKREVKMAGCCRGP